MSEPESKSEPESAGPPGLPTFPEVLREASPLSINELGMLAPKEFQPEDEIAYIELLRAFRARYEKAMGEKRAEKKTGTRNGAGAKPNPLHLDPEEGGGF